MKKTIVAKMAAIPLLAFSSMAYAVDAAPSEPIQLDVQQMDEITAGGRGKAHNNRHGGGRKSSFAWLSQVNISPVIIIQIGNNNTAVVYSGNFAWLRR